MSYVTAQPPDGGGEVDVDTDGEADVATPPRAVRVELYAGFFA
jgi:hypothetical protein